jgi:RNA polymerase sigma-70 factor (ECF subfamily)
MAVYASNAAPSDSSGKHERQQERQLPDTNADDLALLAQIASGQEDALRQLYATYRPRLWRFISQQTYGNSELTNTVLQDVFLAVWRTAGSYRGDATIATWLFRIARNIASNARRGAAGDQRLAHRAAERVDDDDADAALEQASPEQEIVDRLTLAEVFGRLSPKYRVVVELVFAQGFTYEETAEILDVPLGTVKSRLNAARQALAKALADHE